MPQHHTLRHLLVAGVLLLLTGCAAAPPVLPGYLPAQASPVMVEQVPFYPQERYQCGPAALAMSLGASGVNVAPATLIPKIWIPQLKGSLQAEIVAATRRYQRVPYIIAPELPALLAEVRAGHPVLVLLNLGWSFYPVWHYAVVVGYRPGQDALVLNSGTDKHKIVATRDFLDNWRKAERWGLVTLEPGELPAGNDAGRYLKAVAGLEQLHPTAAEPAYAAATRRWPEAAAAWLGLGNTRYASGDINGAAEAWRALIERQPQLAIPRNNLAQLLAEHGCVDAARQQIDTALSAAPERLRPALQQTSAVIPAQPESGQTCPAGLLP